LSHHASLIEPPRLPHWATTPPRAVEIEQEQRNRRWCCWWKWAEEGQCFYAATHLEDAVGRALMIDFQEAGSNLARGGRWSACSRGCGGQSLVLVSSLGTRGGRPGVHSISAHLILHPQRGRGKREGRGLSSCGCWERVGPLSRRVDTRPSRVDTRLNAN
jgi:hypothetical protein